jgi:3-carboxy-cis,cis-muconate cycloisomerase
MMSTGVFDSLIHRGLFTNDETAAQLDDRAEIKTMLQVEAALARATAKAGLIPGDAADRIARAAEAMDPDPAGLAEGTASSGVPVGALVAALREKVGEDDASWVHWGATSQDIVDTAMVLRMKAVTAQIDTRLAAVITQLREQARRHAGTPMTARTRSQAAVPTSFGLKVAGWAAPLERHRARLVELAPRALVVQLGGAAGTRSVFGTSGNDVVAALAEELGLGILPLPWQSQRDGPVELAGWLALVSGSLAKLGQDVVLLAQSEVGEVNVAAGGGSSTMPQKSNPVAAEILVALARHNATLVSEMHHAQLHAQERDGAAWSSEWLALPQMAVATGAALDRAAALVDALVVDSARMADNLAALNGLVLAEAATFALARHLSRRRAEELVKLAAERVQRDGGHLFDHLTATTDAPVDWEQLKSPGAQIETAKALVEKFLARDT